MKRILLSSLLFTYALLSCSKGDDGAVGGSSSDEVSFVSDISTRLKESWSAGDEILVTASSSQSATYSYGGSMFTSSSPIRFTSTESMTFNAVYPAEGASAEDLASGSFSFTAPSDQSSADSYAAADLLVATTTSQSRTPSLSFKHAMSVVVIETSVTGSVTLNMCSSAQCSVSGSASSVGESVEITPYVSSGSYSAVVAPQSLVAGELAATLNISGRIVEWVPGANIALESGKAYTFEWDVDANEVTLVSTDNIGDWSSDGLPAINLVTDNIISKSGWSTYYENDEPKLGGDATSLSGTVTVEEVVYDMYLLPYAWDGVYAGTSNTNGLNYFHSKADYDVGGIGKCITIDLGAEYYLSEIFLSPRRYISGSSNHTYGSHMIKTFDIYGVAAADISSVSVEADNEPDFTDWTPILTDGLWAPEGYKEGDTITDAQRSELLSTGGAWFSMTSQELVAVRYIRLHAKTNWGNTGAFTLAEIDLKGVAK